jgi:hypothetical protein
MFESLSNVPNGVLTEAAYLASLQLHVRATRRCPAPCSLRAAELASAAVAADVLREIERVAAKPLPQLSDEEVGRYTARLLELVMERLKAGRRTDPRRAKALLAEMRVAHAH